MFRNLIVFAILLLVGTTNAFAPVSRPALSNSKTELQFGFLKELGLEKPSWLPDFGDAKKEEEPAPAAAAASEDEGEGEEGEEAAVEE